MPKVFVHVLIAMHLMPKVAFLGLLLVPVMQKDVTRQHMDVILMLKVAGHTLAVIMAHMLKVFALMPMVVMVHMPRVVALVQYVILTMQKVFALIRKVVVMVMQMLLTQKEYALVL